MNLSMKARHLVACAVAGVLGSAGAFAAGPLGAPPAGNVFYFGGGSAEPQAIAVATCNLMNNVDAYSSAGVGNNDASYLILYGNLKAALGTLAANAPVMVMYKFNGGSLPNGGIPQTAPNGLPLTYPTVASVSTFAVAGPGNYCTPGNGVGTVAAGPYALTNNQIPAFGLTDLEVTAFGGINNPLATLPVVGAHVGVYDLVFGMAATSQLFAQKQNFTYSEVAGILAGITTDWSQLYGDQGAFANKPLPAGPVVLLDRNVGSGHKASSTAEFLQYPQIGGAFFQPNSVAGTGYIGGSDGHGTLPVSCAVEYQDIQEKSAGNTVNDLKLAANSVANGGCNMRAIGILSMDNPPGLPVNQNVAGTNAYDFVSLNGTWVDAHVAGDDENGAVATSYDNVIKGNYTWFYQANFNTRSSTYLTSGTNDADLAAAYLHQLQSSLLPGCGNSPGLKFPGNMSGVVNDLDNAAALAACVTVTTRNGLSDTPLFPYSTVPGNITLGSEPL